MVVELCIRSHLSLLTKAWSSLWLWCSDTEMESMTVGMNQSNYWQQASLKQLKGSLCWQQETMVAEVRLQVRHEGTMWLRGRDVVEALERRTKTRHRKVKSNGRIEIERKQRNSVRMTRRRGGMWRSRLPPLVRFALLHPARLSQLLPLHSWVYLMSPFSNKDSLSSHPSPSFSPTLQHTEPPSQPPFNLRWPRPRLLIAGPLIFSF